MALMVNSALTVTNTGNAELTISAIAASGDFHYHVPVDVTPASCASGSVAPGASCEVDLYFSATAAGSRRGVLTITDNAPGSPHTVALLGTGQDFSLGAALGSSTSAIVAAGATATYNLSITPGGGFAGTRSFSCAGGPPKGAGPALPPSGPPDGSGAPPA